MPTAKRRPAAKKPVTPEPAEQPAQQEEAKPIAEEQPPVEPAPVEQFASALEPEPEPELAPEHVRTLARTVRRHLGNPRIQFDAAPNVPVMFGYKSLHHVVHGHPTVHIATRDELSEMSDQQIYDRVMAGRQPPRQGFPIGG